MRLVKILLIGVAVSVCLLVVSCNKTPEPNEYVNYLDRFFTFSTEGVLLSNEKIQSTVKRGFADFTGDGIEDMIEIRDVNLGEIEYQLWLFEGRADSETNSETDSESSSKTKLLSFSDPYSIDIPKQEKVEGEKEIKWGEFLKFDTADVNGDGFADIVLSQFIENWGDNEFNLLVSLNKGFDYKTNKITFRWVKDIIDHKKKGSFTKTFLKFLDEREAVQNDFCLGNNCDTSDRYVTDWADMDANGTDDLVVFWRETPEDLNLFVEVFYTNAPIPSDIFHRLTFAFHDDFSLPKIFNDDYRSYFMLDKIEMDDFNGDGFGDFVLVAQKSDERVLLKFALNTSSLRRYDGLSFMTDAITEYPEIDWDLLSTVTDKVGTLDMNFDGCADYAHIGQSSYFPSGPKGSEIKNMKTMYYMLTDCEKAKSVKGSLSYSEKLIGVKWPRDTIPRAQEKVVGLLTPAL